MCSTSDYPHTIAPDPSPTVDQALAAMNRRLNALEATFNALRSLPGYDPALDLATNVKRALAARTMAQEFAEHVQTLQSLAEVQQVSRAFLASYPATPTHADQNPESIIAQATDAIETALAMIAETAVDVSLISLVYRLELEDRLIDGHELVAGLTGLVGSLSSQRTNEASSE